MFSINLGIKNTTTTMNPTIRPIGLFTIDITEKGSRICKQYMIDQKTRRRSIQLKLNKHTKKKKKKIQDEVFTS